MHIIACKGHITFLSVKVISLLHVKRRRTIIANTFNSYEFMVVSKKANSRLLLSFHKLVYEL